MANIDERVKAIIAEKLGVSEEQVTNEATFTQDLGADSLETVELMLDLEKEFDVSIPDDVSDKIQTVGQAVEFIEKAIEEKA
ncbi:MAG: acyl carrier protein [Muribaculaceae bacterium]|nr:acyl carrier protein [Muribaculaceae bacterium]